MMCAINDCTNTADAVFLGFSTCPLCRAAMRRYLGSYLDPTKSLEIAIANFAFMKAQNLHREGVPV